MGTGRTVIVFGATSYVAGHLIPRLLDADHRVIGVSRRPGQAAILLPRDRPGLSIATPEEAAYAAGSAGDLAVINLAFTRDSLPHLIYRDNRRIVDAIRNVAARARSRLVHISTAAVFGYRFPVTPEPVRARWRPQGPYIESKIHAEHLMERLASRLECELAIVRLGNVIGPGSPIWVAEIAERILAGKPLGYEGEAGFSNATHVANISSYIDHVLRDSAEALRERGPYHHLAEFSSRRWPELLDEMSEEIGQRWATALRGSSSGGLPSARSVLKWAYAGRPSGYVRAGLSVLPPSGVDWLMGRARGTPAWPDLRQHPEVGSGEEGYLDVLSSRHEFRSFTLPGWEPELDFASACTGIKEWLRTAGYSLKTPASA